MTDERGEKKPAPEPTDDPSDIGPPDHLYYLTLPEEDRAEARRATAAWLVRGPSDAPMTAKCVEVARMLADFLAGKPRPEAVK